MDDKTENLLLGKQHAKQSKHKQLLKQTSVSGDNSVEMKSKIPAVERRYSAPSGDYLKHNAQWEDSTEKAEKKKGIQEKETLNEADESFVCAICDIGFTELCQYNVHMGSKSHRSSVSRKKLKAILSHFRKKHAPTENSPTVSKPHSFCPLCQKNFFEPEDYFQHLQSKGHKKRVSLQKIFNRINADLTDSEDDAESGEKEAGSSGTAVRINSRRRYSSCSSYTSIGDDCFECKHCDKIFEGHVPFAHHLASKSHEKTKRRNSLLAELCDLLTEGCEEDSSPFSGGGHNLKACSE